ncbi:DNA translocase FtsK 4TM domain-containing protein [Maribius pontilimi]|uniref:DNA translocase FtsK n=1 Tax=Palleronia pontilimi TaxID=1964209 RepID=A0A934IHE9_9RHOB|nr:DNA translocase FtsK 4TM domain-containing protein [Palleronia pontilimi]MBJ3763137.1 DNA translocase FtsK 4TM domain-containing protein [Palleronia pontilimi]
MAYQTRGRDPLFDSTTQAALEKRGRELFGMVLIGLGITVALMLGSYQPDDPSWLSATSEPARNMLGRMGASIASPLYVIVGWGAWGFALTFLVWGGRFLFHFGDDRAISRAVFAPIAIAIFSIYASTHVPGAEWGHSFGLGGLFGDTALGTLLGVLSVSGAFGLKVTALFLMAASLVMGGFVLGLTRVELRQIVAWLLRGTIMVYATILSALALVKTALFQGLETSARGAASARAARAEKRALRAAAQRAERDAALLEPEDPALQPQVRRAASVPAPQPGPAWDEDDAVAEPRPSFLGRLTGALRTSEPAGHMPPLPGVTHGEGDDRISSKISDAIKSRARAQPILTIGATRTEPRVTGRHPRGPQPLRIDAVPPLSAAPEPQQMPEPELVAPEPTPPASFATQRPIAKPVVQNNIRKPIKPSAQAQAEAQPALAFDDSSTAYETPPLSLLASPETITRHVLSDEALEENARMLENVLDDYGVKGEIVSVRPGPVVTMYELEPAPGLKASRVIGLADDIARSMSALSARVSTVPGRSVIGIELPNEHREMCVLREILSSSDFGDGNQRLPLALGKDIGGDPVVANLAKMPHLLIAGTTGSGKSVAINTMILSLLYKLTPEECRMIMIDPKMLELSVYDGIPHLLSPVVTDPKKAVVALKWVVGEMEDRYRKMSKMGVRNIEGFNGRVREALSKGELFERTVQTGFDDDTGEPIFETEETVPEILPFIVVVVDEMADLMMVAGKEIEACIQRLAQMARASGIHLIMATQRPSVDVITGTIKANFPTRISFSVTSKIDSRTILGEQGAEQLLGMGDMLYMAGGSKITRVHGPFCSDEEVEEIVTYLKGFGPPEYMSGVVEGPADDKGSDIDAVLGLGGDGNSEDELYDRAVKIAIHDRKCSTSYIQRKLAIGYNKAARLVEQMEDEGVVSSANHVGKREILVPEPQ